MRLITVILALALSACGGGEEPAECRQRVLAFGQVAPVEYGTAATWFSGPLQLAPESVSQAAGVQLYVCP